MNKKTFGLTVLALCLAVPAQAQTYQDPYEGYNRFMFRVNDKLDRHVVAPVARGYRKVTPSPVRSGVRNFFNNLRDVVSFGSNVLRLDVEKASADFMRVSINSTFGIGGLIDIAGAAQMPNNKNTLGDTFASWGWKKSNYFVYPLMGPSTVRDSLGDTITYAFPVKNAFLQHNAARYGTTVLDGISRREEVLDLTDNLNDAALDPYAFIRDMYMGVRNRQVGNTAADVDDIDIDTLVAPEEGGSDALENAPQTLPENSGEERSALPSAAELFAGLEDMGVAVRVEAAPVYSAALLHDTAESVQ
ncbi:phospholipid-binding lipoprotein MlaA [Neisseria sp. HSC-16F19]|nr:VacJ family lipoprotein [Neisseria sp. HSC-16F19]MCP2040369.1 phospholipid-binding lipoprotein MlaA [Neisseria sp. HSC-16F19]